MFGLDHLGLAKYGRLAAAEHPAGWAVGCFSNVSGFGDALPALKLLLDTGRCPRARVHLYWSDNAGHKPDRDYLKKIENEAKRVGKFFEQYAGSVDCRVSGFCEHPLGVRDAAVVRDVVMRHMPSHVSYVNSFWAGGGGKALPGVINEVHGASGSLRGRYDFSFDGTSCFDSDVEAFKKRHASAETFYFWFPQQNGNRKMPSKKEPNLPRPQRKWYPTSREIDSVIYLSTPRGTNGKAPKGFTLKSHADRQPKANPRDGKPCYIIPQANATLTLTTKSGQVVGTFTFGGPFDGGGYRYYCSDWGYLIAEKAKRISGSNVCQLRVNGRVVATVNPAFRAGSFR